MRQAAARASLSQRHRTRSFDSINSAFRRLVSLQPHQHQHQQHQQGGLESSCENCSEVYGQNCTPRGRTAGYCAGGVEHGCGSQLYTSPAPATPPASRASTSSKARLCGESQANTTTTTAGSCVADDSRAQASDAVFQAVVGEGVQPTAATATPGGSPSSACAPAAASEQKPQLPRLERRASRRLFADLDIPVGANSESQQQQCARQPHTQLCAPGGVEVKGESSYHSHSSTRVRGDNRERDENSPPSSPPALRARRSPNNNNKNNKNTHTTTSKSVVSASSVDTRAVGARPHQQGGHPATITDVMPPRVPLQQQQRRNTTSCTLPGHMRSPSSGAAAAQAHTTTTPAAPNVLPTSRIDTKRAAPATAKGGNARSHSGAGAKHPAPTPSVHSSRATKGTITKGGGVFFMISSTGGSLASMEQLHAAERVEREFAPSGDEGLGVLTNRQDVDRLSALQMLAAHWSQDSGSSWNY